LGVNIDKAPQRRIKSDQSPAPHLNYLIRLHAEHTVCPKRIAPHQPGHPL